MLTKRESRVIHAFINCVRHGEYTVDYAITLIEDNARYGWLSEMAKEHFYDELDKMHPAPTPEAVQKLLDADKKDASSN